MRLFFRAWNKLQIYKHRMYVSLIPHALEFSCCESIYRVFSIYFMRDSNVYLSVLYNNCLPYRTNVD